MLSFEVGPAGTITGLELPGHPPGECHMQQLSSPQCHKWVTGGLNVPSAARIALQERHLERERFQGNIGRPRI